MSLELSSNDTYEEVSAHLAAALNPPLEDPSKLRFTQQNNYTQQPKPQSIPFPHQDRFLPDMLTNFGQTSDTLYYEVLDLPLQELERLKTLKVTGGSCTVSIQIHSFSTHPHGTNRMHGSSHWGMGPAHY